MDCGVPYCHMACPVYNICPEWQDLAYTNEWERALEILHSTNNFPEFTGRVCPAPCEGSCTLGINDKPVSIKNIEQALVEKGFEMGWIKPKISDRKTGKKVAVIGSGPAGLAAAQNLARLGHSVTVYEKDERAGGLLTFGIPDFKLEKGIVERRIKQMEEESVVFRYNSEVGKEISQEELEKEYDGIIKYEFNGSRGTKNVDIEISQTLTTINISIKSNEITSNSITSELIEENNQFVLYYTYITHPKNEFSDINPIQ